MTDLHLTSLSIDTHDLGRRAGAMARAQGTLSAPAGWQVGASAVVEGTDVHVDLRLESVVDGVLVSGTASIAVVAECSRCLDPVVSQQQVELQELFLFPDRVHDGAVVDLPTVAGEAFEIAGDEVRMLHEERADLEPALRDAVVLSLPAVPLCRTDCPGLCARCGVRLADNPGHAHETIDPRWQALSDLASGATDADQTPPDPSQQKGK